MPGPALVDRMASALPQILADIEALVTCESPSSDLAAVAASVDTVAELGAARLGAVPERIVRGGCTHLRWRLGTGPSRVLVLGHHDTVWPIGSLGTQPFTVTDGVLRGPGCFDMKAGLVMAFHALAALDDPSGVTLLVTGDEEVGSPSSRTLIEDEAGGRVAALILEASADGGALKTERKGVSLYQVTVHGAAAHAGLEPERGVNATIELAHQVLAIASIGDGSQGTSVTPTMASAGTTANTVPSAASLSVDVRVRQLLEQERVHTDMKGLRPVLTGARVEVTGGPNRMPLEGGSSSALFATAVGVARRLGLAPLVSASVGGASDGNLTAAMGTPTLDGLGAVGGGAHARDEHVLVVELAPRTALLSALVGELLAMPRPSGGGAAGRLERSRP